MSAPTPRTVRLAARMSQVAKAEGGGDAIKLLRYLDPGQEAALVVALLGLIGGGNHQRPGPVVVKHVVPSADLIACGTCGALLHESCKTRGGRSRADHATRLVARRCPCGEPIPKKRGQRYCGGCAEVAKKARQQRYDQARRAS